MFAKKAKLVLGINVALNMVIVRQHYYSVLI